MRQLRGGLLGLFAGRSRLGCPVLESFLQAGELLIGCCCLFLKLAQAGGGVAPLVFAGDAFGCQPRLFLLQTRSLLAERVKLLLQLEKFLLPGEERLPGDVPVAFQPPATFLLFRQGGLRRASARFDFRALAGGLLQFALQGVGAVAVAGAALDQTAVVAGAVGGKEEEVRVGAGQLFGRRRRIDQVGACQFGQHPLGFLPQGAVDAHVVGEEPNQGVAVRGTRSFREGGDGVLPEGIHQKRGLAGELLAEQGNAAARGIVGSHHYVFHFVVQVVFQQGRVIGIELGEVGHHPYGAKLSLLRAALAPHRSLAGGGRLQQQLPHRLRKGGAVLDQVAQRLLLRRRGRQRLAQAFQALLLGLALLLAARQLVFDRGQAFACLFLLRLGSLQGRAAAVLFGGQGLFFLLDASAFRPKALDALRGGFCELFELGQLSLGGVQGVNVKRSLLLEVRQFRFQSQKLFAQRFHGLVEALTFFLQDGQLGFQRDPVIPAALSLGRGAGGFFRQGLPFALHPCQPLPEFLLLAAGVGQTGLGALQFQQ